MTKLTRLALASVFAAGLLGTAASAQDRGHEIEGDITKDEMMAKAEERFLKSDADGDGQITLEEIQAKVEGRAGKHAERHFSRQDEDGDGAITWAETRARVEARFDKMDTNSDGVLSEEEREAARDAMRERRGKRRG